MGVVEVEKERNGAFEKWDTNKREEKVNRD